MAIWRKILSLAALLLAGSGSGAQELVKVPVQIPTITPADQLLATYPLLSVAVKVRNELRGKGWKP